MKKQQLQVKMKNKIPKQYCSKQVAFSLKSFGFDIPCQMCYSIHDEIIAPYSSGNSLHVNSRHNYISAPEQWVVIEWLRIKYNVFISPLFHRYSTSKFPFRMEGYQPLIINTKKGKNMIHNSGTEYEKWLHGGVGIGEGHVYDTPQAAIDGGILFVIEKLSPKGE